MRTSQLSQPLGATVMCASSAPIPTQAPSRMIAAAAALIAMTPNSAGSRSWAIARRAAWIMGRSR
jgi:hypothetical protein